MIEPGKHHVSKTYIPLTVFRGFWTVILIVIIGGLNILDDAQNIMKYINISSIAIYAVAAVVLLLGIIAIFGTIGYKRLTWEITEKELHVYKGILIRKKSHIPFKRIHSVDINAKILDRIFGVVTVKFDTAADSSGSADAKIPALNLSTAEAIRREIFIRKSDLKSEGKAGVIAGENGSTNVLEGFNRENDKLRGIFAGDTEFEMKADAEYRLSNKELVLYCLANGKVFAIILAGLLFLYELVDIMHGLGEEFGESADELVQSALSWGSVVLIVLAMIALVVSLVISFLTRALTYGNFVVGRYDERIQVSTGLLQKKSIGVAVERIQTLIVKQGLIQRILGYAEISLETASGINKNGSNDQDNNPAVIIHPFIKKDKIDDYMSKMLGEFQDIPQDLKGLSGLAMRRSMIRYGMWTVILLLLPMNLGWSLIRGYVMSDNDIPIGITMIDHIFLYASIAAFVLMPILGWAVWKGRAYGRNDRFIGMRKGILGRKRVYIHKKKIQYAQISQNPFQKRVFLVTIKVNTAARGSSDQSIKDVKIEIGDDYLNWV